jgi:hypothetical protein
MPRIKAHVNAKPFEKDMHFFIEYTIGALKGIEDGKEVFLQKLGPQVAEIFGQYIDKMAQMDPQTLHHVYEWERVGMRAARLY